MNGFLKKKNKLGNFHKLMMEKNFPPAITLDQIRKKWSNIMEEYHKAIFLNNTKWTYYDLFKKYLGDYTMMQNYTHWDTDWISQLIKVRTKHAKLFLHADSENFDGWNTVEKELRIMGLPSECSVQKIDQMWFSLIKTFKIIHKYYCEGRTNNNTWPFYEDIREYFNMCEPTTLDYFKKCLKWKKCEVQNDCKDYNSDSNLETYNINENNPNFEDNAEENNIFKETDEEFRWTQQWTESFIHIRLQNHDLFKQKKQAWKNLHKIMMENGFPKAITVNCIRRKWNKTFEEYQKAVATNNNKWIYYDIIFSYIGKLDLDDTFSCWTNEWIKILIDIRLQTDDIFKAEKLEEDDCWGVVERELRNKGIPSECSVRNIPSMWSSLIKTFKIKHKYADHSEPTWEFYNDMKNFFLKSNQEFLNSLKKVKKGGQNEDYNILDSGDDDFHSADSDWKLENSLYFDKNTYSSESCRACLGKSEVMTPLFESHKSLANMIMSCTSLQISELDSFPKQLCHTCVEELTIAYRFKKKCEETDKILKNAASELNNSVVKCEMDIEASIDLLINSPDVSCHLNSDNEDKINDLDSNESMDATEKCKKKENTFKKVKRKSSLSNVAKKTSFKSKNIVMVPVVGVTGKTTFKRKYVYWKVCDICGKSTQRMSEHMKGHSDVKTHKCPKCSKTFTYSSSLQSHLRTHDSTPLKVCQLCGKEFYRNLTYKRHLVYHANERKFSCETCGKTFNTSDILRVHIRSHTGERPYSCKICGKSFYSRGCVARHQKTHRKPNIDS